jgi:dephospho-CoA kinase
MRQFYLTGVSGNGKSSISDELNKRGIPSIDIDSVSGLCHWINIKTRDRSPLLSDNGKEFFDNHEYLCNKEKLIDLMNEYKDKGVVVVVGLADNYSELLELFDKTILLHCDEEVFLKRITERTNHDFGKHVSEKEMIMNLYKDYEKEMIDKGAIAINTDQPLEIIISKVIDIIKN